MNNHVQIYHDSLLQNGGAEQVASLWAIAFKSDLNVLAKSNCYFTESDFSAKVVFTWIRTQRTLELVYPFLPVIYPFLKPKSDQIRLVSTTGVAHHIPGRWKKRVLYIHSPARWIWDKESFDINRKKIEILAANILRPFFKFYDRKSIKKDDILLSNSNATRLKIKKFYSREADVVFPPIASKCLTVEKIQLPTNFSKFFLHVGRVRGYKGIDFLLNAFESNTFQLVMVGESTEKFNSNSILGLGFVSPAQLRWLYENAEALIAVSREDFGLTPVEASLHGCPTIAFRHYGYLDSVKSGVSGKLINPYDYTDFDLTLSKHNKGEYSQKEMYEFAKQFTIESHLKKLRKYL